MARPASRSITWTRKKDYYWHAKATVAGKSGTFGSVAKVPVGIGVILNPPVPIAPLQGRRPVLGRLCA